MEFLKEKRIKFLKNFKVEKQRILKKKKADVLKSYTQNFKKYKQRKRLFRVVTSTNGLIKQDSLYRSKIFNTLINKFMKNGKKVQAEKIVYKSFRNIKWIVKMRPFFVFFETLQEVKPLFRITRKRIGKVSRLIPFPIKEEKRIKKVLQWLKHLIKTRKENSVYEKIVQEFNEITFHRRSQIFNYKNEIQQQVILNRAYLHYRW